MRTEIRIKRLILLLLVVGAGAAADEFPGIERLMTRDEFERAGLECLSAAQLEALDAWLIRYTANDATKLSENVEIIREQRN